MADTADSFLPYGRQSLDADDIAAVRRALESDFLTTGPEVGAFESELAAATGAAEAVVCSSGTAGLHLATAALELGPGDAVAVPAITFVATANCARYCSADVVFTDVDPDSGLMTPETLETAIAGKEIKAVLPVHLAGQSCDMTGISEIARKYGAAVIEDAAHAIGTTGVPADPDCRIGDNRHSDMAAFSFHPVKTMTSGEGGAVTTNDAGMAEKMRRLRHHAMSLDPENWSDSGRREEAIDGRHPWYYETAQLGFNYRITDIQCALGRSQLKKLPGFKARRSALMARYTNALMPLAPTVRPITRIPDCDPAWHLCPVLIDFEAAGVSRADVMRRMRTAGIGTQVHYVPVPDQPYYRNLYGPGDYPGAQAWYERTLSLPLHPAMKDADVTRVTDALAAALNLSL